MASSQQTPDTLTGKLRAFVDRHRVQASVTFAVLTALTFIASQIFSFVQQFVIERGIIQYVTLLVVLDLAVSVYLHLQPPITQLARNQDESLQRLIDAVPHCRTEGVDLLEYAGATTLPLIRAIRREGVRMRMLVKHPDSVAGLQRQRMITTLDTLFNSIFDDYQGKWEIRCYRLPFTVRGRRLGSDVLEIGWLTHDLKRQTAYGHSNPSVLADLSTKNNEYLRVFFDRTFNDIWDAADTEDAGAVLQKFAVPLLLQAGRDESGAVLNTREEAPA